MIMQYSGKNLLPAGGEAYYFPGVFDRSTSDYYFNELSTGIRWKQEPVKLFGKEIMQPRLTAWYGDMDKPYEYSGLKMETNEWIQPLIEIKKIADEYAGTVSSSVLLNLYRDGNDGLGWHRDNEKMLGPQPVIASVSLGATRLFQFRNYRTKDQLISIELESGSLLIMKGDSQKEWEHRVPKRRQDVGARINLTFRSVR
jgi:alkylated DNA repair dioxygenase AlkB